MIIVEDSRLARLELKAQLADVKHIAIVGEADSIAQAQELLAQHNVDLMFLDIDLPDGNGFDLLLSLAQPPKVIFTTAFEEFALKAFEQNAIDYLLKPFSQERLQSALARVNMERESVTETKAMMDLSSRFFVKDGQQCFLIQLAQVERFESLGNYTQVYFDQHKTIVYRTLAQIEARLPKEVFFRTSRQYIVQLSCVQDVALCASGGLELTMSSGAKVEVSRRQASQFKALFSL